MALALFSFKIYFGVENGVFQKQIYLFLTYLSVTEETV